jgi:hypothetical protein
MPPSKICIGYVPLNFEALTGGSNPMTMVGEMSQCDLLDS